MKKIKTNSTIEEDILLLQEKGTFTWKWGSESKIDRRTLLMLMEGVTPKRLQARYKLT